jgi:uncharacterized lipoprotein YddW (UPF0748 family)
MPRALLILLLPLTLLAAPRSEYRAFWADTFNTSLNSPADIEQVISRAQSARANALFVQVRRRGDAWFLNSLEPLPDFTPSAPAFDPLYALIQSAHAARIEVHAFVILGAIWNKNPTFAPTVTLGPPTSPQHAFNRHSGFDPATNRIEPGPDNWLTRTLLPDTTPGITFQGHRFGAEFWLDFGHPDAAAYTVEVVSHLVRNYPIDGLHLDRIRYPDFAGGPAQSPAAGVNIGYNAVSVWRFQEANNIPHDAPPPDPFNPAWSQWRRDQVTNVVRRIYLNALAIRPSLTVSAALIVYGGGPASTAAWRNSEAYWRVFQDWRAWLEEGIIDIAIPMNYKREHIPQQAAWFDQWNEWTRAHQYNRASFIGLGVYLNGIEGSIKQIRRTLAATPLGVNLYALANPDAAVDATPARGFAEFAAALTTQTPYDPNPEPIFAEEANVPTLPWKTNPTTGHLMGTATDTAAIYVYDTAGALVRTTTADGGGFFGVIDLPPGEYTLITERGANRRISTPALVTAGNVATVDFP